VVTLAQSSLRAALRYEREAKLAQLSVGSVLGAIVQRAIGDPNMAENTELTSRKLN
jgi:hypothetical protein